MELTFLGIVKGNGLAGLLASIRMAAVSNRVACRRPALVHTS